MLKLIKDVFNLLFKNKQPEPPICDQIQRLLAMNVVLPVRHTLRDEAAQLRLVMSLTA